MQQRIIVGRSEQFSACLQQLENCSALGLSRIIVFQTDGDELGYLQPRIPESAFRAVTFSH